MPGAREETPILCAVQSRAGLKLCVLCGYEQRVSEVDRKYVDELLEDFAQRSRLAPEDLFEQLANLSVGPLVTASVGEQDASHKCPLAGGAACFGPA